LKFLENIKYNFYENTSPRISLKKLLLVFPPLLLLPPYYLSPENPFPDLAIIKQLLKILLNLLKNGNN